MSKVYDIFSFNNELDMLELRLNILDPYVDYFVLVEANTTFSGVSKNLHYEDDKDRFSKFHPKIIHHKVMDSPKSFDDESSDPILMKMALESSNVTREHICWLIEFYQKEHIKKALRHLEDDDICIVSDVDEIWNYELNLNSGIFSRGKILKPKIDKCYIEYLNVRTNENWTHFTGPIICDYNVIKNSCLNHIRTQRKMKHIYTLLEDGGWHFNALGGSNKKIEDFKHPVYDKNYMNSRKNGWRIDETGLPTHILENKEKYRHLFKQ